MNDVINMGQDNTIGQMGDKTTQSFNYVITGDNFEGTTAKRQKKSDLNSVDLNLESTVALEIASRLDYGYKKVENEHKPLD